MWKVDCLVKEVLAYEVCINLNVIGLLLEDEIVGYLDDSDIVTE